MTASNGQVRGLPTSRLRPTTPTDADVAVLLDELIALRDRVVALEGRVDLLEAPRRKVDDLAERVVAFLDQHRALRFTAGVIAENLAEDNRLVGARLDTLARQGRIDAEKRDGKVRVYFAKVGA